MMSHIRTLMAKVVVDVTRSRVKFNSWFKLWEFQGGMVDSYENQERRQGGGC